MKGIGRERLARAGAFVALASLPATALQACPVCFGESSSKMAAGANNAIILMLIVVGLVQIGFVAMFVSFWRRGRALRERREHFRLIEGGLS